jgi:hypothetical protein
MWYRSRHSIIAVIVFIYIRTDKDIANRVEEDAKYLAEPRQLIRDQEYIAARYIAQQHPLLAR